MLKHSSHKHPNTRSAFLSELMRVLSGDSGASVISAYTENSVERFRTAMGHLVDKLVDDIEKNKSKVTKEFSTILKYGNHNSGRKPKNMSTSELTFDKAKGRLTGSIPDGNFPHEVHVTSHHTGKKVVYHIEHDEDGYDGEMAKYNAADHTVKAKTLVLYPHDQHAPF